MAGTVTLLFTDLVGSTELLGRLGEHGAAELRRRHFADLRGAIDDAGGREVKSLGDGLMVAFDSAAAAVACAQAMQLRAAQDDVRLRIGLHVGEPSQEEDDYFGTPVVVASRLCDRAQGGQILASDLVRGLIGTSGAFRALGPLTLKGLSEPVPTWEVLWGEQPAAEAPAPALQAPLPSAVARDERAFVGRGPALDHLRATLAAAGDQLRIAGIGGEPGIGKTRLAAEFARAAHADGAVVLFGRSDEEALVPYQPFAEAIRTYLAAVPAAAPLADGLERLIGAGEAIGRDTDPSLERLALFDAVARFLTAIGRAGPLVLVLDDIHWADAPTLALLRHLARLPNGAGGLVVATYRESELSRTHPLSGVLAELRREKAIERVPLAGLGEEDVGRLLEDAAGHPPPRAFVRALHFETEGNPFFIEEIVRHLIEAGAIVQRDGRWTSDRTIEDMGIPEGVREAVGRRLARLSDTANRALACGAVLGRRFDFDVVATMSHIDEDDLLDAIDEGLAAQLIVEAPEHGRPAYAFRHALVRETLYEELSLPRRQRMHLRAAEAVEQTRARDLDSAAATLALHLQQAGAAADPAKALEWTLRAAAAHWAALAWEEAAAQLEAALELMEEAESPPEARAQVLERLADLHYISSTDLEAGLVYLEDALAAYEAAGMEARAARIHSRLARDLATYWGPTMDIPRAAEHMAAARAVLEGEESAAVAMLEVSAATVAMMQGDGPGVAEAAQRAIAIGRALDRPLVVLNAEMLTGWAAVGAGDLDGLRRMDAAWEEADRRNHPWLGFLGTWVVASIAFWVEGMGGYARRLDRELLRPRIEGMAGQRQMLRNFRGQADAMAGRLDAADAALAENPLPGFPIGDLILALWVDPAGAIAIGDAMTADADRMGNRWSALMAGIWRSHATAATNLTRAVDDCEAVMARMDEAGFSGFAAHERGTLAMRLALVGEAERARRQVALGREIIDGDRWPAGHARLLGGEAAIAAAEGDSARADALFAEAAKRQDDCELVLFAAEARRAHGLLTGRVEPIEHALAAYERVGAAKALIEQARAERERVATGVTG